jgi:GNAT superfamily N-acetyltransferase
VNRQDTLDRDGVQRVLAGSGCAAVTGSDPPAGGASGRGDVDSLKIRPIRADDRQAFLEAFERLGELSRYRRFLTPRGPLTDAELSYFIDVDHHDHEALVAVEPDTGQGVGVARYIRSKVNPAVAELAVAVVDDWQGQGVGSRLAEALAARARSEGIGSFSALMLADNEKMLNLVKELGDVHDVQTGSGTVELIVDLPEHGLGAVSRLLRATARGQVSAIGDHR